MRTVLINTILFLLIVILGITVSSAASIDNEEYAAANSDWMDFDTLYPVHQLDARAAKSRFWKRAPHRKFWKRSASEDDMSKTSSQ